MVVTKQQVGDRLVFVACPYRSTDPEVEQDRLRKLVSVDKKLISLGIFTVAPLERHALFPDHNYWHNYCRLLIDRSDWLFVIALDDWENSSGVDAEFVHAQEAHKPILVIDEHLEILARRNI